MSIKIIASVISVMFLSMALNLDKLEQSISSGLAHSFIQAGFIYGVLALLGRRKVVKAIFALLLASIALIKITYNSDLTVSIIMSLLSTNSSEIKGFVENNILWLLLILLISVILLFVDLSRPKRPAILVLVLAFGVYAIGLGTRDYKESDLTDPVTTEEVMAIGFPDWMVPYLYYLKLQTRYFPPLQVITETSGAVMYLINARLSIENGWINKNVSYHGPERETLILVIGESIKVDFMGIFNGEEQTNPLLSRSQEIKFKSVAMAAGTNTWAALPSMLSYSTQDGHDISRNIINLAKAAGYKTFWFSNQGKNGIWDLGISAIAESSDVVLFMTETGEKGKISPDGVLLPVLEDSLENNEYEKKLIIVHLYGSHMKFKDRYPPEFNVFGEEDDVSTYRNTILYNDYVVDEILKIAARYKGKVLYVGDHGLTDADDNPPLKHDVRKNPSIKSLRVPLLSTEELNVDPVANLYFFECIFTEWASIEAEEINGDHCEPSSGAKSVFFLDAKMRFVRKDLEENVAGIFRQ